MPKFRTHLSVADRSKLFRRFKAGDRLLDIAAELGRAPGHVYGVLLRTGGFEPPTRTRSKRVLTEREREEILLGVSRGDSSRAIARRIGRSASTVCREVARNGGRLQYRATIADARAWDASLRPKQCKLSKTAELAAHVSEKLARDWSPQQISGWLRRTYPGSAEMNVSHETIYKTLFIQARGALKKELMRHLRHAGPMRGRRNKPKRESAIPDPISIRERPAEANDRAVPGHWEGDLIAGYRNHSFIATLVERWSRFVLLAKVESKDADHVAEALKRAMLRMPEQLRRTLTWDRGTEMASHKQFTIATDVAVYFCDPHSPWQRGSNENTNGLLRQYFPKGMKLSDITQDELDVVAAKLNGRPRETLGWSTPAERLSEAVATTG